MSGENTPPLLVACLCAEWCGSCRGYRAVFESLKEKAPAGTLFRWIDIEDEADLVDDIDVDNFPSLLIARGHEVLFDGPVTPHAETAAALIARAARGELRAHDASESRALVRRLLDEAD